MKFLAANWLYILIWGAMIFIMLRGGGCCGHGNHKKHGDSHGENHGGDCGGGHDNHDSHRENNNSLSNNENVQVIDIDFAQDPICGMSVSKKDAISRLKNGKTYYFCSENCANEFEKND